jgi:hypothetical protein
VSHSNPTAFPVRWHRLVVYISLLIAFAGQPIAQGRASRFDLPEFLTGAKPVPSCCGGTFARQLTGSTAYEYETYRLTATYYNLNDNLTATLMLNNKGAGAILATPTIYSMSGTRLQLAPITVPAASYIDVDMHQLLAGQPENFREGSLKIAYQGIEKQLGAQVKLIDAGHKLIWAEQLSYTSKFVSNKLEKCLVDSVTGCKYSISRLKYRLQRFVCNLDGRWHFAGTVLTRHNNAEPLADSRTTDNG